METGNKHYPGFREGIGMDSLDPIFQLLTKERRRFALYYLEKQNGSVSVEELADKIQEWENNSTSSDLPYDAYEDIILTLKHRDLPKAAEVEFIKYDPEQRVIEVTGSPSEFNVILSVAEAIEQPRKDDIIHLK